MGRFLIRTLIALIFRLFTRLQISGLENLPAEGGYLLVSNHQGRLDAALVYHALNRKDILLLVAEKYARVPIFRWATRQLDAIFVDRFNADIGALREALRRLKRGYILVMAPEGTRSPNGLVKPWPGAAYLGAKTGAPIIPVAISGTQDRRVVANLRRLRRTPVWVKAGKAFTLPPLPSKNREAAMEVYADEMMCRIAALLPVEERGIYTDHPRCVEILNTGSADEFPSSALPVRE